jgi:NADH-quinone oxidoreductase subunit L
MQHLWLIPALPLAGFLLNGLLGRRASKTFVSTVAVGSVLLSFLWAVKVLLSLGAMEAPHVERYFTWIESGELRIGFDLAVDRLTAVMLMWSPASACSSTSIRSATWRTKAATTASSPT